jgi:delta14-sterol reductase
MVALPPLVYYLWICVTYYQGELVFPSDAAA